VFVGLVLITIIVDMGFHKYDGIMKMVSTNSKAISAACHCPEEEKPAGYLFPVQWAVVEWSHGVGHCSMMTVRTERVGKVREGARYK
jgi:hypothetical protein